MSKKISLSRQLQEAEALGKRGGRNKERREKRKAKETLDAIVEDEEEQPEVVVWRLDDDAMTRKIVKETARAEKRKNKAACLSTITPNPTTITLTLLSKTWKSTPASSNRPEP